MSRVLVRPFYRQFLNNRLFDKTHPDASHWQQPFTLLREAVTLAGGSIDTIDCQPLLSADVLIFLELPGSLDTLLELRALCPRAKCILIQFESPLGKFHWGCAENYKHFDLVVSYFKPPVLESNYRGYRIPNGYCPTELSQRELLEFDSRRDLVLINRNKSLGNGIVQSVGLMREMLALRAKGWRLDRTWHSRGGVRELYGERVNIVREFAKSGLAFDIYGDGWSDVMGADFRLERFRVLGRLDAKMAIAGCFKFALAYENCVNSIGYVSEKIIDAFYMGAVPIYKGFADIGSLVPRDSYIDAREFRSGCDLVRYIRSVSASEWRGRRAAAEAFLSSAGIGIFQPASFVSTVVRAIEEVSP